MLRHLLEAVDKDKRYRIDEIWALDAVQHGDSALVNAQNLGSLCEASNSSLRFLSGLIFFSKSFGQTTPVIS